MAAASDRYQEWVTDQSMLSGLFTQAPVGLSVYGPDAHLNWTNDVVQQVMGWHAGEWEGRANRVLYPHGSILSPPGYHEMEEVLEEVLRTGEAVLDVHWRGPTPATCEYHRVYSCSYFRLQDDAGHPWVSARRPSTSPIVTRHGLAWRCSAEPAGSVPPSTSGRRRRRSRSSWFRTSPTRFASRSRSRSWPEKRPRPRPPVHPRGYGSWRSAPGATPPSRKVMRCWVSSAVGRRPRANACWPCPCSWAAPRSARSPFGGSLLVRPSPRRTAQSPKNWRRAPRCAWTTLAATSASTPRR